MPNETQNITPRIAKPIQFLTRGASISHFLLLVFFFIVVMIIFIQPTDILRYTSASSSIHPMLQIAIMSMAGMLIVLLSRIFLFSFSLHHRLSDLGVTLWLLVELVGTIAAMLLSLWGLSGGGKIQLAPLAGNTLLGIISVEIIPYVISYLVFLLQEEHAEVERLKALLPSSPLPSLSADQPVNFYDRAGRLVFGTLRRNIIYIEAANNYANIHYLNNGKEDTFILHNSLKELEESLSPSGIVRCHRCFMINLENIKLIRKDGSGLLIELEGCSRQVPVSKTYTAPIIARQK